MSLYSPRMGAAVDTTRSTLYSKSPSTMPAYTQEHSSKEHLHLYVLPVLLLEFLALALTRAVLPGMLLKQYGSHVYLVMGIAECVRGLLAFVSCPLFGKVSDVLGRRLCLFVTVAGTCAPVCFLALMSFQTFTNSEQAMTAANVTTSATTSTTQAEEDSSSLWHNVLGPSSSVDETLSPLAITLFVVLLSLSGVFSSTFTLVFAYISDTVHDRKERVTAYGLALATFGLSFTIGPMAGGYIANAGHTRHVFTASLVLTILDLIYIYAVLPESNPTSTQPQHGVVAHQQDNDNKNDFLKFSWASPWQSLSLVVVDPFLRRVGMVAFYYYTSLWAVISTLILYAAKRFELGPERLGELMSALGLSTMIAEAVLVRILVPILGEKRSMQLGLASFVVQCVVLGFAFEPWHLFACALFSLLGNLVYPSLSSLVSASVEPQNVGEALGAINGIKALTEGIGPLVFGSLMTLSEQSALPGWPYLLAALLAFCAYQSSKELPDLHNEDDDHEYIHELEMKHHHQQQQQQSGVSILTRQWMLPSSLASPSRNNTARTLQSRCSEDDDEDEYAGLLVSEIEESEEEDQVFVDATDASSPPRNDTSRLPVTFVSLTKQPPSQP